MKQPLLVANWKMNPTTAREAFALAKAVQKGVASTKARVVLCPPFPFLSIVKCQLSHVALGAQNCSWLDKGPLTGEVSPVQLKNVGCSYVILGHSERKKYLRETLAMIHKKAAAALKAGLRVVLCVESASELREGKKKLKSFAGVVVVYEPRAAISTQGGKRVPPKEIAKKAGELAEIAGRGVPILYGGSVDAKSIGEIMRQGKVQGALVGAASLNAKEFDALVKNAVLR